eukprot:364994-Chlamydomonas_euryale.AAC.2
MLGTHRLPAQCMLAYVKDSVCILFFEDERLAHASPGVSTLCRVHGCLESTKKLNPHIRVHQQRRFAHGMEPGTFYEVRYQSTEPRSTLNMRGALSGAGCGPAVPEIHSGQAVF